MSFRHYRLVHYYLNKNGSPAIPPTGKRKRSRHDHQYPAFLIRPPNAHRDDEQTDEYYTEEDDEEFVIYEEELTSSSMEERLLKSKQQGKLLQQSTSTIFRGLVDDENYEDDDDDDDDGSLPQLSREETFISATAEDSVVDAEQLSEEQALALEYIQRGENVFITGVAGTGKSVVLRKALEYLARNHRQSNRYVAVAPTGSTAIALEGQTIHSFAGIGVPKLSTDFGKTKSNKITAKHWRQLKVLVLDEVSMVSGEFFDNLSRVVSEIRTDPRPFGGIQLVVCGDFLQLSPIPPRKSEVDQMLIALQEKGHTEEEAKDSMFLNRGFCFQSMAWKEAKFKVIELQQVFRQRNQVFVNILQEIRTGKVTSSAANFLKLNCERPLPPNDFGIKPTILHSKNVDVSRENQADLERLNGEAMIYGAEDDVTIEKGVGQWAKKILESSAFFSTCLAEPELRLKIGAQVILIKNMNRDSRLVNGSRGTIVGFRIVRKPPRDPTMHLLTGISRYPVVQFLNGLQQVVMPQKFQSRLVGLGTCTRVAIPLRLAWALTAHKAQGLTLDFVIADVGQVFAEAQMYVALSRASDERGLELRNFSKNRVRANPLALQFHEDPNGSFPYWWEGPGGGSAPKAVIAPTVYRKCKIHTELNVESVALDRRNGQKQFTAVDSDDVIRAMMRRTRSENSSSSNATTITLKRKSVPELKNMLRKRGLKVSGRKAELIDRLLSA